MIFWKECRETVPLILLSAIAIPLISLIRWERWRIEYFEFQFWVVVILCLPFTILFFGAAAVAGERENGTFEYLVARPLRLSRIFLTKYLVRLGCIVLVFPLLLAIFHFMRPTHNLNLYDVAKGLVILFGFLLFCFSVSFCASCFTNTTARAFVASLILVYMTLFVINGTPLFKYAWWWRNSLDDLWLEYLYFYAALSLLFLILSGVAFSRKIELEYSWKIPAVAVILLFLLFVRSVSTTFWLVPRIALSGDMEFVQLCREPVVRILDYTSQHKKGKKSLLREYLFASRDTRIDKELIRELSNPEARIRNEALKFLIARETERAKTAVMPLLKDPDTEVKHSTLAFVFTFECKEAVPELINLIHDSNSSIRTRAVGALGRVGGKDAIPYLMEALKDSNPRVHTQAAYELCRLDCAEAKDEIVRMMLESPIKHTRRTVARHLAMLKSAPACDALIEALSDTDEALVRNATYSLGKLQCEDAVGPLMEILNDDSYWRDQRRSGWRKASVIAALKYIRGGEVLEALKAQYAETESTDILKVEIAISLLEMGDDTGLSYLRELMARDTSETKESWINSHYASRLVAAGDYSGVPVLIRKTGEGPPQQRYSYGKMLTELTGKNYGWDKKRWEKWWEKNEGTLLGVAPGAKG